MSYQPGLKGQLNLPNFLLSIVCRTKTLTCLSLLITLAQLKTIIITIYTSYRHSNSYGCVIVSCDHKSIVVV